jgi:hypothetical protein
MKDDYLWDKTGDDPDVKELEDVMAEFRYEQTPPPPFQAQIVTLVEKEPRLKWSFALAFAAAAVVVTFLGVWLQMSGDKTAPAQNLARNIAPPPKQTVPDGLPIERPIEMPEAVAPRQATLKSGSRDLSGRRETRPAAKVIAREKRTVTLTAEERYAYDQLMLALSITGSKLKVVHDTIDRVEDGGGPDNR